MRERRILALVLAVLVVFSAFALPLGGAVSDSAGAPSGMVGLSSSNLDDIRADTLETNVSAADLEGAVYVSEHASTTTVSLVTKDQADEIANGASPSAVAHERVCSSPAAGKNPQFNCDTELSLVISDDVHDDGRTVAIKTGVVQEALGYLPDRLTVRNNETEEEWSAAANVRDGWLVADVPHFSSNTVTWSGQVSINGTPATDGSSYQYEINNLDSVDNYDINVTGATQTEWDNVSGTRLADGDTLTVDVAGNADPTGPSSNDEPEVVFTGVSKGEYNPVDAEGDGDAASEVGFVGDDGADTPNKIEARINPDSEQISELKIPVSGMTGSDYGFVVDIYIASGKVDETYGEGTLVKEGWDPSFSTGVQTITLSSPHDVTPGNNYTVEFITQSTDNDGSKDRLKISADDSAGTSWYSNKPVSIDKYANITVLARNATKDPAVDIDGDGTDEASHSGTLSGGETVTKEIASLSPSDDTFDISATSGQVDVTAKLKERTQTVDPSIEVNGNWANFTGTVSDGSTEVLSTNTSWVVNGTNRVNVTVGDGSLSADAPTPSVDLDYNHDASDDVSVTFEGEKFTERYNVSKTFSSSRDTADLTIPFDKTVVEMRDVEIRRNSSSWSTVSSSDYTLSGTTLTVELGSVDTDETVDVRANGSKVSVNNGTLEVTEVTATGSSLNSKVKLTTWNSDSYLAVTDTGSAPKVHHAENASWTTDDAYHWEDGSGTQRLYLPNAGTDSTARLKTIPVSLSVTSGEVKIKVPNPSSSEPEFVVKPGASSGDTVQYTFESAQDNTDYILYSVSQDIVRDSGTASSPLTLEDDDSDETLQFQQDSDGGSSDGGASSGGGGIVGTVQQTAPPVTLGPLLPIGGVMLLLGGAAVAFRRRRSGESGDVPVPTPGGIPGRIVGAVWGAVLAVGAIVSSGIRLLVGNRIALAGLGVVTFAMAARIGLVPERVLVVAGVISIPLVSSLVLKRLNRFSVPVFAVVAAMTTIFGLELVSPGSVIDQLGGGLARFTPIVLIVIGVLGWRWLQARQEEAGTPDEVNQIIIDGEEDGGSD